MQTDSHFKDKPILWIGGVSWPEDFTKLNKKGNKQVAANITQINYINGIEKITGSTVTIISGHMVPTYPQYSDMFLKKERWEHNKYSNDIQVPFTTIPMLRLLSKTISLTYYSLKWLRKKTPPIIFVYSLHSPYIIAGRICKLLNKKTEVICIIPDLPEYMNLNRKKITKVLKKFEIFIINKSIIHFDKFILFSKHMKNNLPIQNKKTVIVECVLDPEKFTYDNSPIKRGKYLMYSGMVDIKYGLPEIIEAFSKLKNSEYELWITGSGSAKEYISNQSKLNRKIKYLGFIDDHDEVIKMQQKASLLLNTRKPTEEASKYCFPSKLVEYMATGTPTFTFKIDGIPNEYYDYVLFSDSINSVKVASVIDAFLNKSEEEMNIFGSKAREFVFREKNYCKQIERIFNND